MSYITNPIIGNRSLKFDLWCMTQEAEDREVLRIIGAGNTIRLDGEMSGNDVALECFGTRAHANATDLLLALGEYAFDS